MMAKKRLFEFVEKTTNVILDPWGLTIGFGEGYNSRDLAHLLDLWCWSQQKGKIQMIFAEKRIQNTMARGW
jgi:hypothetical protein